MKKGPSMGTQSWPLFTTHFLLASLKFYSTLIKLSYANTLHLISNWKTITISICPIDARNILNIKIALLIIPTVTISRDDVKIKVF